MYAKLFSSILDSSVWLEAEHTRIVWLTLLAAKDEDGFARFATIDNLAVRARVSVEKTAEAVGILAAPDPNSSNPDHKGRRIERVPGGWVVLNATIYDAICKRAQEREQTRDRVRRHRAKSAESKQSPPTVPDDEPAAPIVSEAKHEQPPLRSPSDQLAEFVQEFDFGPFAPSVEGIVRAARSPIAIIATMRMHLSGDMDHELATVRQLGLACQQYLAQGQPFNASYFAGFIRNAKRGAERTQNRKRNQSEDTQAEREKHQRAREAEEQAAADRHLEEFETENADRFAELHKLAEAVVPKNISMGRKEMVRANLLRAIALEPPRV